MSTHVHEFRTGSDVTRTPLVLVHGSEGSEADLVPLADELAPDATRLAIRGAVALDRGYAFFRRLADRSPDESDLAARVPVLAALITATCRDHGLTAKPVAIGFSNGAIMSAALLLSDPTLLAGAILFRPLPPFAAVPAVGLDGISVLIIDGADDHRRAPDDGRRLAEQLRGRGAVVDHHVLPVGHAITATDRRIAREWLH